MNLSKNNNKRNSQTIISSAPKSGKKLSIISDHSKISYFLEKIHRIFLGLIHNKYIMIVSKLFQINPSITSILKKLSKNCPSSLNAQKMPSIKYKHNRQSTLHNLSILSFSINLS
jgi:hypothetical protein